MLKTALSGITLAALLFTGVPVFAEESSTTATATTMTAPAQIPSGGDAAACMKNATEKKNAAHKVAEQAYKTALDASKNTKDKAAKKSAQDMRKKAQKAAKEMFEKDRKDCTSLARAAGMEKKEMKKEDEKKMGEGSNGLERLVVVLKEKIKALEENIKSLEALINPKSATVTLSAQNNSGESGTAMLKEENGKVKVMLDLTGAPASGVQPAHVHMGSCATLGGVKYPLTFPTNGKSETVLDVKWDDLKAALPLAINVHKSVDESTVYVVCGDLKM